MSLAIKFGDNTSATALSGAIYFDVVTKYDKNFSGKVTEHPIEAGASITDHYISSNPKYNISGILSHIDFSSIPSLLVLEGEFVKNNQNAPSPATVSDVSSGLGAIIPGVLGQFISKTRPTVSVDTTTRQNSRGEIESFLKDLMTGLFYNEARQRWQNQMTTASLYEMEGSRPGNPIQDLVCTSVQVTEDENSGDALVLTISFEQVKFVTLEKVDAPKAQVNTPTGRATSDKANKGTQSSGPSELPKEDTRITVEGKMKELFR